MRLRTFLLTALALAVVLAVSLGGPDRGSADSGTDPGMLPIPLPDPVGDGKSVIAKVEVTGDAAAALAGSKMVLGRARGRSGNPPLLRVELGDYHGDPLDSYDEWDPRWSFVEDGAGGESLEIATSATGRFVVPFSPDLQYLELVNQRAGMAQMGTFDLGPAIRDFCSTNPSDPDCLEADLALSGPDVTDLPGVVLLGEPVTVTLEVDATNNGPDGPVDVATDIQVTAEPGLAVTPASHELDVSELAVDEVRTLESSYQLACVEPGLHEVTFTSAVDPARPAVTDPVQANNTTAITVAVDCAVPITIVIRPDDDPNVVNRNAGANAPVAILTTTAGEYGNPLAVDATTIDPLSLSFGSPDLAAAGHGVEEAHGKGHPQDTPELDGSAGDGDTDLLLHFSAQNAGLELGDEQACLRGTMDLGAGTVVTVFGCDAIEILR